MLISMTDFAGGDAVIIVSQQLVNMADQNNLEMWTVVEVTAAPKGEGSAGNMY